MLRAWGMVGTLIGLINMMKTMGSDSSAIGSGMSLALITTLYGSIIANWICIPIARKLEKSGAAEALSMELVVEGVLSIQAGENSRIIKEKLSAIVEKWCHGQGGGSRGYGMIAKCHLVRYDILILGKIRIGNRQ